MAMHSFFRQAIESPTFAAELIPAKRQILLAGEKLFARQGLEGTSLREIAVAAGHGNNNAVRYHFGSKEGLMQAIFEYRAGLLEPIRFEMLREAESANALQDLRTIVAMICLPHLGLRDDEGNYSYAAFLIRYLLYQRPQGIMHPADREGLPALQKIQELFYARLSFLSAAAAERRLFFATISFLSTLVNRENKISPISDAEFVPTVEDVLGMITSAVGTPEFGAAPLFGLHAG
jgi:AcrR family transcriptional regulator